MLARSLSRLTYANVIATLALFLALGGGAYAAIKLPKNSVGTAQIKSGAITKPKLDKKLVKSLKGAAGAQGPAGPKGDTGPKGDKGDQGVQGIKGDAGPTGPSDLFVKASTSVNMSNDGASHQVLTATLEPGDYLVRTSLFAVNNDLTAASNVVCVLDSAAFSAPQTDQVYVTARGNTDGAYHQAFMEQSATAHVTTATSVTLSCSTPSANMQGITWVAHAKLYALRVGTVTGL